MIYINPLRSDGLVSDTEITGIDVKSDNESVATVDTGASFGERFVVRIKGEGIVNINVTAYNDDAMESVSEQITLNIVNPVSLLDVTGHNYDMIMNNGNSLNYFGDFFDTITIKVKDEYKDSFYISPLEESNDVVTMTEENGLYTFKNHALTEDNFDISHTFEIKINDYIFIRSNVIFELDPEVTYKLEGVDMFFEIDETTYRNGDTINVSLTEHNILFPRFKTNPLAFLEATNILTSVDSSNKGVARLEYDNMSIDDIYHYRYYVLKLYAAGETTITLHTTDSLGFEKTSTFTLVVTE